MLRQSCQSLTPTLSEGSCQALHLESTLQDLPLHRFEIEIEYLGWQLAQVFEHHPFLPGAVLVDQGNYAGMLSRQRLLEYLIRPHGLDIFLAESLQVLYGYARCDLLLLPGTTPILVAAQQALRRSPELLAEPVIVQDNQTYYLLDIHELNIAHWQIRGIETQVRYERIQAKMIQNNKMASLGRLVDGVAHEILDPVSFIWGNLSHIASYSNDLLTLMDAYEQHLPVCPAEIDRLKTDLDIDYLRQDLPRAIASVKTGAERLSKLASSLQNFCHIDEVYPKSVDLHEAIDGILLLLKSRLTSEIQVIRQYGQLPPVLCFPGQLQQVFMNILSRCLDSLLNQAVSQGLDQEFRSRHASHNPAAVKPTIQITTQVCSLAMGDRAPARWVFICIADNGPGLSTEAQQEILESFSIKKRAEKETSLAVSYQIVTAKHGGKLWVRSRGATLGDSCTKNSDNSPSNHAHPEAPTQVLGTEFEILLPLA
ncbi:MAG: sensor histidine kinase [Leptolyngbyaceae cyanobacterium CAN_BIN12]|nr:sensor histidine kinase [Leptolyngbyaceae cyanobacterium CAN_BIN12]